MIDRDLKNISGQSGLLWPFSFNILTVLTLVFGMGFLASCNGSRSEIKQIEEYTGPIRIMDSITVLHSDSGVVTAKVVAPKVLEYQNEDREFPNGVYLEFFNKSGKMTSFLKANHAYFTSKESVWKGKGDVVLKNIENEEQLNTEELYWEPNTSKVYTDKFVNIESGDELLTGTGLETTQDFSSYTILKPEGIFSIEE